MDWINIPDYADYCIASTLEPRCWLGMNIEIRVQPNASKDEILGWVESVLRIRIKALPENGRANEALVSLLASVSGIPKSQIRIIKGFNSRNKVISIQEKHIAVFPDIFIEGR